MTKVICVVAHLDVHRAASHARRCFVVWVPSFPKVIFVVACYNIDSHRMSVISILTARAFSIAPLCLCTTTCAPKSTRGRFCDVENCFFDHLDLATLNASGIWNARISFGDDLSAAMMRTSKLTPTRVKTPMILKKTKLTFTSVTKQLFLRPCQLDFTGCSLLFLVITAPKN